jgi:hypothetical protein
MIFICNASRKVFEIDPFKEWRGQSPLMFRSAAAFADGLISIEQLLFVIHKAWCQRVAYPECTSDAFHFLLA